MARRKPCFPKMPYTSCALIQLLSFKVVSFSAKSDFKRCLPLAECIFLLLLDNALRYWVTGYRANISRQSRVSATQVPPAVHGLCLNPTKLQQSGIFKAGGGHSSQ